MLASWVMQAGFEPPMITVALHKDRVLARWLADGNAVHSEFARARATAAARTLSPAALRKVSRRSTAWTIERASSGAPVLAGTVGYLECEPAGHLDSADHRIFLARVTAGHLNEGRRPLVHVRKNGMKY